MYHNVISIANFKSHGYVIIRKYWVYYAGTIQPYSLQQMDEDITAGDEAHIRQATQEEFDRIIKEYGGN